MVETVLDISCRPLMTRLGLCGALEQYLAGTSLMMIVNQTSNTQHGLHQTCLLLLIKNEINVSRQKAQKLLSSLSQLVFYNPRTNIL